MKMHGMRWSQTFLVVDLPTYDMVWGMGFLERFDPAIKWRKRSMVIAHRQQRHTFSAHNPHTLPDACSFFPSVFNLCSVDAIARDTRNAETELDWDGAVLGCLSPNLNLVDASHVGAGQGGTDPLIAPLLSEFRDVLRTEIPGGLPPERFRADGTRIEHTIDKAPDRHLTRAPPACSRMRKLRKYIAIYRIC